MADGISLINVDPVVFSWPPVERPLAEYALVVVVDGVEYAYSPMRDISAYELALIVPILMSAASQVQGAGYLFRMIEALPDEAKRHWKRAPSDDAGL